jgi:hypothetical protein
MLMLVSMSMVNSYRLSVIRVQGLEFRVQLIVLVVVVVLEIVY